MLDRTVPDGAILRCPRCGGDELFEDGRFYCFGWCNETSGSDGGEASGPDLPPSNR